MATPLELADIVNRLVDELGGDKNKIGGSTLKLFTALSAAEKQAVSGTLKERLARQGQATQLRRQRGQQQFQLRRDQSKQASQLRLLDRKAEITERQKSAPQRAKDLQRTIGVRKQQATGAIRRARGISGSPQEVQSTLRLLAEVDPEAARVMGDNFRRNPGSTIVAERRRVPGSLREVASAGRVQGLGFPTGPSRGGGPPSALRGTELAISRPQARLIPSESTLERAAKQAFRGKLGKGALIGGAALSIPLILSALGGDKKSEELDPAAQFQLMQALQSGGGRGGTDPALQQGRELRNVLNLLNVIKQLRGMESTLAQPTAGIV